MKYLSWLFLTFVLIQNSYAQNKSEKLNQPFSEYLELIYNENTDSQNQSYNYSNLWDFDGDGINDQLYFIGNGGAHTFYYLKLILSYDAKEYNFPFLQIDMPYPEKEEVLIKYGKSPLVQFMVSDFDKDNKEELYLNFSSCKCGIPNDGAFDGLSSECIIMYFDEELIIKDYFE